MFSVIIPVYNKAKYLHNAVESVLAQTVGDWEMIIVDDGSTDDFASAVKPYEAHERIHIIRKPNGGVSTARNAGIDKATMPYYCFLDADDEWLPNHLACFRRMIEAEPGAGVYATAFRATFDDGESTDNAGLFVNQGVYRTEDLFGYMESIGGNQVLNTAGTCVSAEAVKCCGSFVPGVRIGEDTDFYLRIAARWAVVMLDEVTAVYHRERSTATSAEGFLNYNWCFEQREADFMADPSIPASKKMNIRIFMDRFRNHKARHYLMEGKRKEALQEMRKIRPNRQLAKALMITGCMLVVPSKVLCWVYRKKKEGQKE